VARLPTMRDNRVVVHVSYRTCCGAVTKKLLRSNGAPGDTPDDTARAGPTHSQERHKQHNNPPQATQGAPLKSPHKTTRKADSVIPMRTLRGAGGHFQRHTLFRTVQRRPRLDASHQYAPPSCSLYVTGVSESRGVIQCSLTLWEST
jgi:hypothetical protein